jgi:hypothetical protein
VAAGWGLSRFQLLTTVGYAMTLPLAVLGLAWLFRDKNPKTFLRHRSWLPILSRRFRHPLPLVFLGIAGLELIGGLLYAPANYDAVTYRLPRLLHWWSAGHWFWIPTLNDRMNFSGTTWEWIGLPFLVFTHSDRGLFLINALGFLLLPGLLFAIFRQLGVARRVAWTWMWLLPLAYGFVTQAGSIGNDLTGTVFCLLSVYFGLQVRPAGRRLDDRRKTFQPAARVALPGCRRTGPEITAKKPHGQPRYGAAGRDGFRPANHGLKPGQRCRLVWRPAKPIQNAD